MNIFEKSSAKWIWTHECEYDDVNQYVEFRHEFSLDNIPDIEAKLYISADTDYAVWVNGNFINCNQYDDYPEYKIFDILSIDGVLKKGSNILCILVYYQGESSFQYIKGQPGVIYVLETKGKKIISNNEVRCRKSPSYLNGPIAKVSPQLSFTFEYDARGDDSWLSDYYCYDESWGIASIQKNPSDTRTKNLHIRPIKKIQIGERICTRIISQGKFIRTFDRQKTAAELVQSDFISYRNFDEIFNIGSSNVKLPFQDGLVLKRSKEEQDDGVYIILDVGREEVGLLEIELEAGEGTVVDFAYGQHLDDLRVRASVGGRNFANRYICKSGRQNFIHYFKRISGRYIQLHISNISDQVVLYYAGLRPAFYPVEQKGSFECSDDLYNKIHEVCVRTLHLCMHEHYEDTPWREQALYSMDSKNQALCGYYCFGEYDFPQACFTLLGYGLKEDGYLEICAPAESTITIPSFSMAWIIELADHLLYSGRIENAQAALPRVKKMMDMYIKNISGGLLVTPIGDRYWHFYEWAQGLDSSSIFTKDGGLKNIRFDAPLNLFFCLALGAAANIAKACNQMELATSYEMYQSRLKDAFHNKFWNDKKGLYETYCGDGCDEHYAQLTQALALCAKACPDDLAPKLREKLVDDHRLVQTTLSHSIYKYEALMGEPEKYANIVFNSIAGDWGYMLFSGATSFWETINGAADFGNAGSLCHGWSAIPIYFYYAYILGIKPVEPGFRKFTVKPVRGIVNKASGKIPTPYGIIDISLEETGTGLKCDIKNPEGTEYIMGI